MSQPQSSQSASLPAEFKTCDTCKHGVKDGKKIACFGVPPTPILIQARPGQFGGIQMQMEQVRPQLDPGTRACSLHATSIRLLG